MNNCSYEQSFICSPAIYSSIMHKKIYFKFMQFIQYRNTASYPILSVISPRSYPYTMPATLYNHTTLSHIIHNSIIYYAPYNYISIIYIILLSSIYHVLYNQIHYCYALYYYILYQYIYKPMQHITHI